jgi:hypothetical protein
MSSLSNASWRSSTTQTHVMTSTQYHALTASQQAAFSAEQKAAMTFVTPLVLDLDGNGVRTLGLEAGVQFDLAASGSNAPPAGSVQATACWRWTATAMARSTTAANCSARRHGWPMAARPTAASLAALDDNGDGKIDAKDSLYRALRVWIDADADGVSQPGELKSWPNCASPA